MTAGGGLVHSVKGLQKITKRFLGKKDSSFSWMCKTCRDLYIAKKIERLMMTVVGAKKDVAKMKKQQLETVERSEA